MWNRSAVSAFGALLAMAACGPQELSSRTWAPAGSPSLLRPRAELRMAPAATAIPNQYIVVLKPGTTPASTLMPAGASPRRTYSVINGYAAELSAAQVEGLRADPGVQFIEQNQRVTAAATQQGAPWGLDRIDQRTLPLSTTYGYRSAGFGVSVYVIDSGLASGHPQFGGRAANVFDVFGGNGEDCNGHGTYVAGAIGSRTYGASKGVYLLGVKVVDCTLNGSTEQLIAGIDWVTNNHVGPAIANIGLGVPYSEALNAAATRLSDSGVFVVAAAGNSGRATVPADACQYSPGSAPGVMTVAATTSADAHASYSNSGPCIGLYAPGSSVTSTYVDVANNVFTTKVVTGTSLSGAYVAGVAAMYKDSYGDAPQATVEGWLKAAATRDIIQGVPASTPNLLLNTGAL